MPKAEKYGVIYLLVDPDSIIGEDLIDAKYVGYTTKPPEQRLKGHVAEAKKGIKTYKCNWIRSLLAKGKKPVIIEFCRVPVSNLAKSEIETIADLKQCYKLTNSTLGGDGVLGLRNKPKLSAEARKRISQSVKLARQREIRQGRVFEMHSPKAREKAAKKLRGFKHSKRTRLRMSAALRKRYKDPEQRIKTGLILSRPKSEEHRRKLSISSKLAYNKLPDTTCPICGFIGKPGVVGMHRKNKGH